MPFSPGLSFKINKKYFVAHVHFVSNFLQCNLTGSIVYGYTCSKAKPGANNADEKTKQLWIDKEKLVVVKFINYSHGDKEEGIFGNHKQFLNSWSETSCLFYVNGKLIQKETYYDCKAKRKIDIKIFNPYNFSLLK